jgi:hypothetical protein
MNFLFYFRVTGFRPAKQRYDTLLVKKWHIEWRDERSPGENTPKLHFLQLHRKILFLCFRNFPLKTCPYDMTQISHHSKILFFAKSVGKISSLNKGAPRIHDNSHYHTATEKSKPKQTVIT